MTRLDDLLALRAKIDAEITAETRALARRNNTAHKIRASLTTPQDIAPEPALERPGWTRLADLISGAAGGRQVADQRHIAMWVLRQCGMSYPEIGRWVGRHHSTAIYGVRRVTSDPYLHRTAERVLREVV